MVGNIVIVPYGNCLLSVARFRYLIFQHLSCLRGQILTVLCTPPNPSETEDFELQFRPVLVNFTLRILNGNGPVFIIHPANSPNTTLGTTDFDLEFRERTDFEPAGPPCRHESESMGFQNWLKVFAMITPVAAVCNQ
jgi:hypothetical protein